MTLRDVGFFVRGRINSGLTRVINRRRPAPLPPPVALAQPPADTVPLHGFLGDALGHGETEAGRTMVLPFARLQNERAPRGL